MGTLSRDEIYLLDWLAKQDGADFKAVLKAAHALDSLIAKGLVMTVPAFAGPLLMVTNEGWKVATGT